MNLASAVALRNEILSKAGRQRLAKGARLHSLAREAPSGQLAVGVARGPGGGHRLEVRVQRPAGQAFRVAADYRDRYPGEVRVQVVPDVELLPYLRDTTPPHATAVLDRRRTADPEPLRIGLSVGRADSSAGTIGAFVRLADDDRNPYLLGCNHVLARFNRGTCASKSGRKAGDHIYHPGSPDQKPLGSKHRVGRLGGCIDLQTGVLNAADAAVAVLNAGVSHAGTAVPAGLPDGGRALSAFAGDPLADLRANHPVRKVGRTTGDTRGVVTAVGLGPQAVWTPHGKMLFADVIEVTGTDGPFSAAGDSGGLVFLADTFEAVGLVFAGGTVTRDDGGTAAVSYVCLLATILQYFDATLV